MAKSDEIRTAINRCCDWLIKQQSKKGNWSVGETYSEKIPNVYQKDIIVTSDCLQALAYSKNRKYLENVSRALNYCLNYKPKHEEDVESWAWRLAALRFSGTKKSEFVKNQTIKYFKEKQKEDGSWPFFVSTHTTTNYSVVFASASYNCQEMLDSIQDWFLESMNKNGTWRGFPEASQTSSAWTGTGAISLLMLGENPAKNYFRKIKKTLLDNQKNGWSKHEEKSEGTWPVCMCTEALMRLSSDPFNENVEAGIKTILENQAEEGYFPRNFKTPKPTLFTSFYAIRLLTFYLYLKEKLASKEAKKIGKYMKDKRHVIAYYADKFEEDAVADFKRNVRSAVINSRALGATKRAVRRRKDILKILWEYGENEIAAVIDLLKQDKKYSHLNKKSYITQIKADMNYLRALGLVQENDYKYFASVRV